MNGRVPVQSTSARTVLRCPDLLVTSSVPYVFTIPQRDLHRQRRCLLLSLVAQGSMKKKGAPGFNQSARLGRFVNGSMSSGPPPTKGEAVAGAFWKDHRVLVEHGEIENDLARAEGATAGHAARSDRPPPAASTAQRHCQAPSCAAFPPPPAATRGRWDEKRSQRACPANRDCPPPPYLTASAPRRRR